MLASAADHKHTGIGLPVQFCQEFIELAPEGRPHGVEGGALVQNQVCNMVFSAERKTVHDEILLTVL